MTIKTIDAQEPTEAFLLQSFLMADEFGRKIDEYTKVLTAYDNYSKLKKLITENGIDNTLITLWGDELEVIAPSIFKKDRDAVLKELDAVHEGYIIKGIASDIYNFIKKIIQGVIKFIKTMFNQSRRMQAVFRALRKKVDVVAHIDTRQLSYRGYDRTLVHNTLVDNGGFLVDVPIIDKDRAGERGFMNAFNEAIAKHQDVLKIKDENRLFLYSPSIYTFAKRKVNRGYVSLSAAGIENSLVLRSVLNQIDSNLDMIRQFEAAVTKFETSLNFLEGEYGNSSDDVMSYVKAHGTYISTYMATVPSLLFEITADFMEVMKQTLVTTKD